MKNKFSGMNKNEIHGQTITIKEWKRISALIHGLNI